MYCLLSRWAARPRGSYILKDPIEVNSIKDHRRAHAGTRKSWTYLIIEEATFDAKIGDRLLPIKSALFAHHVTRPTR